MSFCAQSKTNPRLISVLDTEMKSNFDLIVSFMANQSISLYVRAFL